jgi:hypothetical protein
MHGLLEIRTHPARVFASPPGSDEASALAVAN